MLIVQLTMLQAFGMKSNDFLGQMLVTNLVESVQGDSLKGLCTVVHVDTANRRMMFFVLNRGKSVDVNILLHPSVTPCIFFCTNDTAKEHHKRDSLRVLQLLLCS